MELFKDHDLIKNPNIEIMNYFHDEEGKKNIPGHSVLSDAWTSYKYQSDVGQKIFAPRILHQSFQEMCRREFNFD